MRLLMIPLDQQEVYENHRKKEKYRKRPVANGRDEINDEIERHIENGGSFGSPGELFGHGHRAKYSLRDVLHENDLSWFLSIKFSGGQH